MLMLHSHILMLNPPSSHVVAPVSHMKDHERGFKKMAKDKNHIFHNIIHFPKVGAIFRLEHPRMMILTRERHRRSHLLDLTVDFRALALVDQIQPMAVAGCSWI